VTPHSARLSFISTLQAQGVEVGLVAKLAEHKSAVVTLSHYTRAIRGERTRCRRWIGPMSRGRKSYLVLCGCTVKNFLENPLVIRTRKNGWQVSMQSACIAPVHIGQRPSMSFYVGKEGRHFTTCPIHLNGKSP
jgi:hypothetical protein